MEKRSRSIVGRMVFSAIVFGGLAAAVAWVLHWVLLLATVLIWFGTETFPTVIWYGVWSLPWVGAIGAAYRTWRDWS